VYDTQITIFWGYKATYTTGGSNPVEKWTKSENDGGNIYNNLEKLVWASFFGGG